MPVSALTVPFLCGIWHVSEHHANEVRGSAQLYPALAGPAAEAVRGGRDFPYSKHQDLHSKTEDQKSPS